MVRIPPKNTTTFLNLSLPPPSCQVAAQKNDQDNSGVPPGKHPHIPGHHRLVKPAFQKLAGHTRGDDQRHVHPAPAATRNPSSSTVNASASRTARGLCSADPVGQGSMAETTSFPDEG